MSDIGEIYKALKNSNNEKRENNRENSTRILKEKGVAFEIKNYGNHLIVEGKESLIDFWPSTGKFITRNGKTGRGVFNLLKLCNQQHG